MKFRVTKQNRSIVLFVLGAVSMTIMLAQLTVMLGRVARADTESIWVELERHKDDSRINRALARMSVSDLLVEAIIQIESSGDPMRVGTAGERGLMQIKRETWSDMVRSMSRNSVSFDQAFDPDLNEQVGRMYLAFLQKFLDAHRESWKADERALLLACYNAGPGRVLQAGFDLKRLPASVQSYVERGSALHDYWVREMVQNAETLRFSQHAGLSEGT